MASAQIPRSYYCKSLLKITYNSAREVLCLRMAAFFLPITIAVDGDQPVQYDDTQSFSTKPLVFLVGSNARVQDLISSGGFGFGEGHRYVAEQIESLNCRISNITALLIEKLRVPQRQ